MFNPSVRTLGSWFSRIVVKQRFTLFILGLIFLASAYIYLRYHPVYYNRSMESLFPEEDERLQFYRKSRQWFSSEHTLLVVYRDPELWTKQGMERQKRLARALESLAGVHRVVTLATSPAPTNPTVTVEEALEQSKEEAEVENLKKRVLQTRLYSGVTIAPDLVTTALIVQLHRELGSPTEAGKKLETIRQTAHEWMQNEQVAHVEGPYTAGTLLMIHDVYEYTSQGGRRLQFYSVLLMAVVIAGAFIVPELRDAWNRSKQGQQSWLMSLRDILISVRWLILPFLVIYSTLTWSETIWSMLRGEMTMVGSAISSLVAVISVTTVVHLGLHYRELRGQATSEQALEQTLRYLGPAVVWVLLTTAGGFGALLVCRIKPVYDFGLIMMLATLLVGFATFLFFPLMAMGWESRPIQAGQMASWTASFLDRLLHFLDRHPLSSGSWLLLLGIVLALGMTRLQPQTDFTNNFRPDTGVYRSYRFIEESYGGAGQLELILDTPDLYALSNAELAEYLEQVRRLEDRLMQIFLPTETGLEVAGISKALSIPDFSDFLDQLPLAKEFLSPRTRLYLLAGDVQRAKKELGWRGTLIPAAIWQQVQANAVLSQFWNADERKLRIVLQARERLSAKTKRKLLEQIEKHCQEVLQKNTGYRLTGTYLMLASLIESVLRDQASTTLVSLNCMLLMALAAFRNWKLALIVLVPTVLPVLAVVGTMGWIGLPVNIATAMLASVAMGMTIDSSLLYLYRLREEQAAGHSFARALISTHRNTGSALLVASLALVFGFSVLTQSRFLPLVHFGLLAALALLGGVIGNLILLPLLLRLTHRSAWKAISPLLAHNGLPNGALADRSTEPGVVTRQSTSP